MTTVKAGIGMCHAKTPRRKAGKKMFLTNHDKKTRLFQKNVLNGEGVPLAAQRLGVTKKY